MNEHPYAGPDTMVPGETADDDPYSGGTFCDECEMYLEAIRGRCPNCGEELL